MSDVEAVRRAIDRAATHWQAGRIDAAFDFCVQALAIDPSQVDALAHAGTIRWWQGDVADAERLYLRAHASDPSHPGVLLNIATLHHEAGDLETSLRWIEKAEAARPGDRHATWRRALVELAMGDYANGWAHYEAGLSEPTMRGSGPGFDTPPWDGKPCDRLLLWHEQGLGDTVQFVRYALLCKRRARRVVVLCPTELTALIASCPGVDAAVDSIGADELDRHAPLMSLPHRFRTTLATVPADVPYLRADPARVARWTSRVGDDRLKVGLVWSGNVRADVRFRNIDRARSMPLDAMAPLLALDGVAFYSLQKGSAACDAGHTRLIDPMRGVATFADTAAIIDRLDLVISVDTAVAHVAGAMGKPVWVLSRLDACWRWLRNRPDSPWYPSARVYGQTVRGDWAGVVRRVRDDLVREVASR